MKAPRRAPRTAPRRLPEHPFRARVEEDGVYIDGRPRFAAALREHVGDIVEVRRRAGRQVEIVDDLSMRRILIGSLEDAA